MCIRDRLTGSEWLGFAGGARALPAPLAGVRTLDGRSIADINAMIASFRNAWAPLNSTATGNGSLAFSVRGEAAMAGQELGYVGSLSYGYGQEVRAGEVRALPSVEGDSLVPINRYTGSTGRTSVLWGGLLNLSTHVGAGTKLSISNPYSRGADNEASQLGGLNEEFATPLVLSRTTFTSRAVRSNQLAGEHLLGARSTVDWSVTNSDVSRSEPDRSDLSYIAATDPATGQLTPAQWFTGQFSATKTFSMLSEHGWDVAANYRLALGALSNPLMLKTGAAFRAVNRDAESQPYDIRNHDLSVAERSVPALSLIHISEPTRLL